MTTVKDEELLPIIVINRLQPERLPPVRSVKVKLNSYQDADESHVDTPIIDIRRDTHNRRVEIRADAGHQQLTKLEALGLSRALLQMAEELP